MEAECCFNQLTDLFGVMLDGIHILSARKALCREGVSSHRIGLDGFGWQSVQVLIERPEISGTALGGVAPQEMWLVRERGDDQFSLGGKEMAAEHEIRCVRIKLLHQASAGHRELR